MTNSALSILRRCAGLFLLLSILLPTSSFAQGWAIELGPSYDIQKGTFVAPCGCTFAHGDGLGWIGAISYDVVSFAGISLGVRTGVDYQQFTSKEIDITTADMQQIANGDREQTKFTLLTIDPYVRVKIPGTGGLFVQASPGWEYILSSDFTHMAGSVSDDGGEASIDPKSAIDVKKSQVNARFVAGYSFGLGGIAIEPMVSTTVPLTDLTSTNAANWHITTWYGSLAFRFGL